MSGTTQEHDTDVNLAGIDTQMRAVFTHCEQCPGDASGQNGIICNGAHLPGMCYFATLEAQEQAIQGK